MSQQEQRVDWGGIRLPNRNSHQSQSRQHNSVVVWCWWWWWWYSGEAGHVYKVLQSRPACPAHFLHGQQVDCLIFYSVFTADHLNLTSSQSRPRYDINQMSTGQFLCLSDWRTTHHLYHCVNLMVQLAVGKISTRLIYFSKISLFSMLWIHVADLGKEDRHITDWLLCCSNIPWQVLREKIQN